MLDFRRATVFSLGYRLSKHKMTKGWFTLGPSKGEPSQAERGKVFTLAIMFAHGCVGCHASEVPRAARVYGSGNGLLFHVTQPTSRSTIKAIACSKPAISEN